MLANNFAVMNQTKSRVKNTLIYRREQGCTIYRGARTLYIGTKIFDDKADQNSCDSGEFTPTNCNVAFPE